MTKRLVSHTLAEDFPLLLLRQRHRYEPARRMEKRPRTNQQITAPQVMLVAEDGGAEVLTIAEALARAQAEEMDLIEVSPKAVPPVVKIGEFGHYLYQLQKKEKKQKSHSKQVEVKMLKFGFRTEKHDLQRLSDRAREFLGERHLVKFGVRLRGREMANKEYALDKLKGIITGLADVSEVEQEMKRQGDQYIVILRPKR